MLVAFPGCVYVISVCVQCLYVSCSCGCLSSTVFVGVFLLLFVGFCV